MTQKDEKIKLEILKWLYNGFLDYPGSGLKGEEIIEDLNDYTEDDILYLIDRMDNDLITREPSHSNSLRSIEITDRGIEQLAQQGYPTLLDNRLYYDLLEELYKIDRNASGYIITGYEELANRTDADIEIVKQNIQYLIKKRLVESDGAIGRDRPVRITDQGKARYEAYRDHNTSIPPANNIQTQYQVSIGPNESKKAENLFRDIVELSRDEIRIIDPYARKPLYELLAHVPDKVKIKVMTSDKVVDNDYRKAIKQFSEKHSEIEVRFLEKGRKKEWNFHDRYIIRDDDTGWAWGHSFHDAGHTQHTASELKPVNRDTIVEKFEDAWHRASEVRDQ